VGQRLFLILILLVFGVAFNKHDPPVINPDKGETFRRAGPIDYIDKYGGMIEFGNKNDYANNMPNVLLVYRDSPSAIYNLWILRAVWKEGELLVAVEMAPGYDIETFFYAEIRKTLEKRLISIRQVKSGELKFLEKDFIKSLPLVIENPSGNAYLGYSQPMYFRITPKRGGPGGTMGYYYVDYDDDPELNSGYAKLMSDFQSAIPWVFAEWLIEDEYEIDEKWLEGMKKMYPKRELDK